jgi:UDP-N-acetylmuramate dehydrogenase
MSMDRDRLESNVPLAPLSTLGVGGPARWLLRATTIEAVEQAHRWCDGKDVPLLVLGGGSNLVIADEGWNGLVLQVGIPGATFSETRGDVLVSLGAGESWDAIVAHAVDRGLAGIECLSGIPGTVGGTPIQNVGAYGQEIADVVERVAVFDRESARIQSFSRADCGFAYRMSRFKREDAGRFIVCGVTLRLRKGPPTVAYPDVVARFERAGTSSPTLAGVREAVLDVRRRKGMVLDPSDADTRSVGSFFMNPVMTHADRERISSAAGAPAPGYATADGRVKVPAAWLIERSGARDAGDEGGASISTKHPLAIVNRGGATARDVVALAVRVKREVIRRFGVPLQPEPVFVGFGADADVEFLRIGTGRTHVDTAD